MANTEYQRPEPLYIKVPPALKDDLKLIAEQKGETLSTISRTALKEFTDREIGGAQYGEEKSTDVNA